MNFSFEGNYKSKRNINLGGKQSHQDKKALLAKAQAERKARERERRRNDSALRIQVESLSPPTLPPACHCH